MSFAPTMDLIIAPDGGLRCIYDETIDLAALGTLQIQRASQVEPAAAGGWTADLRLVDGPVLGPFALRSAALMAEREWLARHWLMPPPRD